MASILEPLEEPGHAAETRSGSRAAHTGGPRAPWATCVPTTGTARALGQKPNNGNTEIAHRLALKGSCNAAERKWPFPPI